MVKEKYVCLRCGNVYESEAKTPQCPVCKSKRKMKYEDFLAIPEEQREDVLKGYIKKYSRKKGDSRVKQGDSTVIKSDDSVKHGDDTVKDGEIKGDDKEIKGEKSIEKVEEKVKKGDSREIKGDDKAVKKGERVKGERVKGDLPIPKPKLIPKPRISLKAIGFISTLAFIYFLYKMGFLNSVIERLKGLGAFRSVGNNEEEVESVERNPILERVKKNLSG